MNSISGFGRFPWEGGQLTKEFFLGNPMDREAWRAPVYGITKNGTWLRDSKTVSFLNCSKNCRGRDNTKLILKGPHHSVTKIRLRYHKRRESQINITDKHGCKYPPTRYKQMESIHILKGSFAMSKCELSQGCKDSSISIHLRTILTSWRRKKIIWSSKYIQRKLLTKLNTHLW